MTLPVDRAHARRLGLVAALVVGWLLIFLPLAAAYLLAVSVVITEHATQQPPEWLGNWLGLATVAVGAIPPILGAHWLLGGDDGGVR